MPTAFQHAMRRSMSMSLLTASAGVSLCVVFAWGEFELLWRSYLLAVMAVWPVALAAVGLLALGNLTGGRWAAAARPFYLAAARTLPLVTLLLVPPAFALEHIYPWAQTGGESAHAFSPAKAAYLSPLYFLVRAAAYLVTWNLVAYWLVRVSRIDLPPASTPAMRRAGALSLVLLVPTTTFAAFDWGMSLEPHWYSSIYGAVVTAGGVVAAHALAIFGLSRTPFSTRSAILSPVGAGGFGGERLADVYNDLGNLLLAFIMLWTYFSFSQFFIIWSANLPSEVTWYERRLSGGWQFLALVLVLLCFVIPFLTLLSRDVKRNISRLARVAALLVIAYGLNMYWTIAPPLAPPDVKWHIADSGALMGLVGAWLALYWWQASRLRIPDHLEAGVDDSTTS